MASAVGCLVCLGSLTGPPPSLPSSPITHSLGGGAKWAGEAFDRKLYRWSRRKMSFDLACCCSHWTAALLCEEKEESAICDTATPRTQQQPVSASCPGSQCCGAQCVEVPVCRRASPRPGNESRVHLRL